MINLEEQKIEMNKSESMDGKQFIVSRIGNEQYGIDIKFVDNIVRMQKITRVPKAPHYYKGVINLRGEIIPVISLRLKFDLEEIEETKDTRIIIIKTDKQNSVGIIVDAVCEVVTLDADSMEKPIVDGSDNRIQYIEMLGKINESLISIININGLISEKE